MDPSGLSKMDFDEFCSLVHSRLIIMTSSGNFEGVLKFVLKKRATFEHVYELPSREYLGTMHILFSSISSWKLLETNEKNFDVSNFDISNKLLRGEFVKSERIDNSEVVEIDPDKHFIDYLSVDLKNKCPNDFCIVDTMDAVFSRALNHLSGSDVIGASFHGPKISRSGYLTWVCLSTSSCVFIFDIEKLSNAAFENGLKEIFESKKIVKVIHDCREVADCLFHLFNTKLSCVFDSQAADYLINMQMCKGKRIFEYVNSLDSCLFKYLKVPQQFLYNRNKSVSFEDEIRFYHERPLSRDFINVLVKSAMYLPLLKVEQEKLLKSPYERAVELYLNSVKSANDSEVRMILAEPSYLAPDCLLESVKSIRFFDFPQAPDDFVDKMKALGHKPKPFPVKH